MTQPRAFDSTVSVSIEWIPEFAIVAWIENKASAAMVERKYTEAETLLKAAFSIANTYLLQDNWFVYATERIDANLRWAASEKLRAGPIKP